MKKSRRIHREDSAAEYPSPGEIAKWSQECDLSLAELGGIKENVHATDVGCWTSSLKSSIGFVKDGLLNLLDLGWRGLALLTIMFIWVAAASTYANNDVTRDNGSRMTVMSNLEESDKPALKPVEHPVIGVISTHHRSGTVLFQTMVERLSSELLIDNNRVDKPFQLGDFTATPAVVFHRYWNATGRVVVGMHGFAETCEKGQNVGAYCPPMDYKCWLDACVFIDQKPEGKQVPVVHVVRNPVETLISSYLYNLQDPPPEDWLYKIKPDALGALPMNLREKFADVPYHKVLKQLPSELGILVELTVEKADLHRMARNYRDLEKKSYAKNLHFEDIKKDFKTTIKSTLDHLKITHLYSAQKVMDIAVIFDLDSMPEAERSAYHTEGHVTEGKHNKDDLRQLLYNNEATRDMLEGLAGVMGYDTAFPSVKRETESVHVMATETGIGTGNNPVNVE